MQDWGTMFAAVQAAQVAQVKPEREPAKRGARPAYPADHPMIVEMRELYQAGWGLKDLALRFSKDIKTVWRWKEEGRLGPQRPKMHGGRRPGAKGVARV